MNEVETWNVPPGKIWSKFKVDLDSPVVCWLTPERESDG